MSKILQRMLLTATALTGLSCAVPALAQTEGEVAGTLDEVVVTARRREESAQTVPVSVTAIGATALQERTVRQLGDLTMLAPGIRFVHQGGGGNMNVVLRGLTKVPIGDAPNSVITYFADVPLNFQGSNVPAFDLASIQVLKGPQGTLFGRNSIGGAVILSPQAPTYDLEGYVKVSAGNYDYNDQEAVANIPLVEDKLALRLGVKRSRRDGYTKIYPINGVAGGKDQDDVHTDVYRVSLLWEPTSNVRNLLVYDYLKAEEAGAGAVLFAALPTGLVRLPPFAALWDCHTVNPIFNPVACTGFQPGRDIDDLLTLQQQLGPRRTFSDIPQRLFRESQGFSNKTEIDLGWGNFRNILGYRELDLKTDFNSDGLPYSPSIINAFNRVKYKYFTEEAHLYGSAFDDSVDWIVGGYYSKDTPDGPNGGRFNVVAPAPWVSAYNKKTNYAFFGQVGWKLDNLVEGLKLNAGYRYSWDKAKMCTVVTSGTPYVPESDQDSCPTLPGSSQISFDGKAPTWTIGLDWQANSNVFAYIVSRRGYREGGINAPAFNTPATAILLPYQTYDPERLTDIEVGLKTDWTAGDWVGRFNISAYRSKYDDVLTSFNTSNLVPSTDPAAPASTSVGINTGKRTLTGIETELVLRPTPSLTFTNTAAYTHQKIDELSSPPIAGLVPPAFAANSPKWATTTAVRWVLPFQPLDGELVFNADYYWQDEFTVGNATMPSYDVANARLSWNNIGGGPADLGFFVRNVTNEEYIVASAVGVSTLGLFTGAYGEPRMYGVELTVRFGQ